VDATSFAAGLLEPIPANASFGLLVVRAVDGVGEVAMDEDARFSNVIGSLHSSGLVALIDAAGLAAVISAADAPDQFDGVLPLGSTAHLEFLAPARGRLVARCDLGAHDRAALAGLYSGGVERVGLATPVSVRSAAGAEVCRGSFTWSVKRARPAAPS